MRYWLLAAPVLAWLQPQSPQPRLSSAGCVSTAPMPIAWLDSAQVHDRYPIRLVPVDTGRLIRMPTARLRPCYLDSLSLRRPTP